VTRFQLIAPIRPARTTLSVIASGPTNPFASAAATSTETNAPAKFITAARPTEKRGASARVEIRLAIALTAWCSPCVQSKNCAAPTTATGRGVESSTPPGRDRSRVHHCDVADDVLFRFAGVDRVLERLVDVLTADDDERVDARID